MFDDKPDVCEHKTLIFILRCIVLFHNLRVQLIVRNCIGFWWQWCNKKELLQKHYFETNVTRGTQYFCRRNTKAHEFIWTAADDWHHNKTPTTFPVLHWMVRLYFWDLLRCYWWFVLFSSYLYQNVIPFHLGVWNNQTSQQWFWFRQTSHKEPAAILRDNSHTNEERWREKKSWMTRKKGVLECHFVMMEWWRAAQEWTHTLGNIYLWDSVCITAESETYVPYIFVCVLYQTLVVRWAQNLKCFLAHFYENSPSKKINN